MNFSKLKHLFRSGLIRLIDGAIWGIGVLLGITIFVKVFEWLGWLQ